ncbi:ribosomal protein S18 acetylase RimI-like enzyme [Kitasatospora gansuensis]|uniref:Ribosomal protein S18 acetylase RimI-like enzyme n=1 Tax=Kitasatospora gansuensis TaxID=258050 RepID=A0A7W7SGW8_9ACTN|nr:GNAT family N-acetyltransferase [Kitasatospora gansuensis]MBB4950256.1 ribosomal protein S18 acetylase RimI-like enzyme [Kitasatospora gansuensis]
MPHPLDNPVTASLAGPHARFAEWRGRAARYPGDMTHFHGLPDAPQAADWADLAALAGPGAVVLLAVDAAVVPPTDWAVPFRIEGVQLVGEDVLGKPDPEAVRLGPADVPEMLELVERTRPGPFLARTIEMGSYLGIRRDGALIAMAGERMHPSGHTEISAVCTDPDRRGEGLASRLILAVAAGIRERGEVPFLHAAGDNTNAIRLYGTLGFRLRRAVTFLGARVPG